MLFSKKSSKQKCLKILWDGFPEEMTKADNEVLSNFGKTDACRKMMKRLDELFFRDSLFGGKTADEYRDGFLNTRQRIFSILSPAESAAQPQEETTSMDGIE